MNQAANASRCSRIGQCYAPFSQQAEQLAWRGPLGLGPQDGRLPQQREPGRGPDGRLRQGTIDRWNWLQEMAMTTMTCSATRRLALVEPGDDIAEVSAWPSTPRVQRRLHQHQPATGMCTRSRAGRPTADTLATAAGLRDRPAVRSARLLRNDHEYGCYLGLNLYRRSRADPGWQGWKVSAARYGTTSRSPPEGHPDFQLTAAAAARQAELRGQLRLGSTRPSDRAPAMARHPGQLRQQTVTLSRTHNLVLTNTAQECEPMTATIQPVDNRRHQRRASGREAAPESAILRCATSLSDLRLQHLRLHAVGFEQPWLWPSCGAGRVPPS